MSVVDRGEPVASCSEWHGDGTGGEDDPVFYLAAGGTSSGDGRGRPGRHQQQHRWQAAEGGAAAARRARYVPALRRRAVQWRSSWIDGPPYAALPLREEVVRSQRMGKGKGKELRTPCHS